MTRLVIAFGKGEMSQPVSPQYLLQGAAYALEQCGFLLRDATALYRSGSYVSAVVLANFAREELGRWMMLIKLRREVIGGKKLSVKDVENRCGDHVARQKAGALSVTFRGNNLFVAMANAVHGSDEWKTLKKEVDNLIARRRKRLAGERHEQRLSALYVDPVSLTEWNRPVQKITQEFARYFLMDASNEYSIQSHRYRNPEGIHDPELCNALTEWTDRPVVVMPEWPF